jgi:hypothetical protein
MADNDAKLDVIIAFDPEDPKRQDKKESLPAAEAWSLVNAGRARWPEKSPQAKAQAEQQTNTL